MEFVHEEERATCQNHLKFNASADSYNHLLHPYHGTECVGGHFVVISDSEDPADH